MSEMPIDILEVGDVIGEIDLNMKPDHEINCSVRAIENTTLFKIDRAVMQNHLEQNKEKVSDVCFQI